MEEERAKQARENFTAGCNCAQAVMLAYADLLGLPADRLMALSKPMGAGMGRLRETCGAVSGAVLCLGLLYPEKEKGEMYAMVQEFARRFREENGSYNCGELLSGAGVAATKGASPEARTPAYYKKRPCADLVFSAARILGEMLGEKA